MNICKKCRGPVEKGFVCDDCGVAMKAARKVVNSQVEMCEICLIKPAERGHKCNTCVRAINRFNFLSETGAKMAKFNMETIARKEPTVGSDEIDRQTNYFKRG